MPRSLSSILIFALLVAQILPLGSVARGAVLCVSLDGHVAIEPVHASSNCSDMFGADADPAAVRADSADHDDHADHADDEENDHGCFDLQLGDLAVPLESARMTDGGCVDLVFSQPAFGISATVLAVAARHLLPGETPVPQGRCALRTVILRL